MNNLFKKIATAFVGIAMAIGVSVAVNKGVKEAKADYYGQTALSALTTGDVGVLVGDNGSNYAMGNTGGTSDAPSAVAVTIANGKLTSDVTASILWEVTNNNGSLQFKVPDSSNYLYSTNSNNGLRVGTNSNNAFVLDSNYLKNSATNRYVGIYNSADWRCYTSINSNINNQTFAFYKLVEESGGDPISVTGVTLDKESFNIEVNEELTLKASVAPVNADVKTVSWSSSDPTVASVTNAGVVKGLKVGTATITATTTEENNDAHADCVINVKEWNYGTESAPLTVSQAKAILDEVGNKVVTLSKMYVTGVVGTSEAQGSGKDYRNVWLQSEDGQTEKAFELFSAKLDSSITGISADVDALKGYTVVAHGWGELYNTTYELTNKARGSNDYDNPMIISAIAPVVKHEVSFAANGGTGDAPAAVEVVDGDEYTLPANPFGAPQGKEFNGWAVSTDATKIYEVGEKITVSADVVLTAQWKDIVVNYTVTYSDGEQGSFLVENVQAGSEHTLLSLEATGLQAPQGKELKGWQVGNDAELKQPGAKITVNGNVTVTAIWQDEQVAPTKVPASLVVTYSGDNPKVGEVLPGEMIVHIKYDDDSVATEDIAEDCEFYVLKNNQEEAVGPDTIFGEAGEVTIYARYSGNLTAPITGSVVITVDPAPAPTPVKYNVTFDYATQGKANAVFEVTENEKVEKPEDPTKEGYDFAGWYLGDDLFDFNTPITQAITLVAHWTEKVQPQPDEDEIVINFEDHKTDFSATGGVISGIKLTTDKNGGTNNPAYTTASGEARQSLKLYNKNYLLIELDSSSSHQSFTSIKCLATSKNADTDGQGDYYKDSLESTILYSHALKTATFTEGNEVNVAGATKIYIHCSVGQYRIGQITLGFGGGSTPIDPVNNYTISFDANGGTGNMASLTKAENAVIESAPTCTFTAPANKEFDKWVDATGAAIAFPYTVTGNATFVASWKDATDPTPTPTPSTDPIVLDGTVMGYPEASGGTSDVTTKTVGGVEFTTSKGGRSYTNGNKTNAFSENNMIFIGKKGAYIYNSTALPAGVSKVEVVTNATFTMEDGSTRTPSLNVKVDVQFGKAGMTTALTGEGTQLGAESTVYSFVPTEAGCTYLRFQVMNDYNAQLQIKIYFGDPADPTPGGDDTPDPTPTPSGHGYSANDPFTVAEALELLSTLGTNKSEQLYVRGKISSIKEVSPKVGEEGFGNATFNISVDGSETADQLTVFRCKYLENADFTAQDQIKVGDDVTIVGQLKNYVKDNVTTPEFDAGCYIQAFNTGDTPAPGGDDTPDPTPAVTLVKIDVVGLDKVNYVKGEALDLSGVTVFFHYSDGSVVEAKAEEFSVSGYDPNKLGQQTITVTAGGMTWTAKVLVTDAMGCHGSILAGSALISLTTLLGAGLLMLKKRKQD